MLVEQLEMHARSGLSLDLAVQSFGESMPKRLRGKYMRTVGCLRSGKRRSAALGSEFQISGITLNLMDAGERSGTLPEALGTCRQALEREDELVKRCVSAAVYPVAIGFTTILLTIGLVEGVMPQIIPMLTSLHGDLPFLTRAVIWISKCIAAYWGQAVGAGMILTIAVILLPKRIAGIRKFLQEGAIRTPILGSLLCSYSFVAFFGSLGSMLEAGVPSDKAYQQAADMVVLLPIRQKFLRKIQPLIRGEPFHTIAAGLPHMPGYAGQLIRSGEKSGRLGASILRIAAMIDRDLDHSLKRMTALLEPAMMLGMGGMVGSVALSIMMPIYDISKALQR